MSCINAPEREVSGTYELTARTERCRCSCLVFQLILDLHDAFRSCEVGDLNPSQFTLIHFSRSLLKYSSGDVDQATPDVLELFHEDAEVYFPKFGFGFGRNSFLEIVKGFEGTLEFIQHDYDRLTFIPSADYLVVEGTSQGRMSGKSWAGGKTPGGRFCNV